MGLVHLDQIVEKRAFALGNRLIIRPVAGHGRDRQVVWFDTIGQSHPAFDPVAFGVFEPDLIAFADTLKEHHRCIFAFDYGTHHLSQRQTIIRLIVHDDYAPGPQYSRGVLCRDFTLHCIVSAQPEEG